MLDRFYYPGDFSQPLMIEGAEAHHICGVVRKKAGDRIELFDGRGGSATAVIDSVGKRAVKLTLASLPVFAEAPEARLTLAIAPPKGDRLQWLIEKATELGIDRVILLQSERTVVLPGASKIARLQQAVIEACKQSRRNHLMPILQPHSLEQLVGLANVEGARLCVGEIAAEITSESAFMSVHAADRVIVVVGPEGGLSGAELEFLRSSGSVSMTVSKNVLRVETAAIAMAAILQFKMNSR